jgi:hypothetical protein
VTTFDDVLRPFLDDLFRLYPVIATAIGDHRFDGMWSMPPTPAASSDWRPWIAGRRRSRR